MSDRPTLILEPSMTASMTDTASQVLDKRVACRECGHKSHLLLSHVVEVHGLTPASYLDLHPGAPTVSEHAMAAIKAQSSSSSRSAGAMPEDLRVKLMGLDLPVDCHVSDDLCLPLPAGYQFPTKGKAKLVFKRALMALARGRNAFIWGMPGTGKDALVHAYSAMTRRPVVMVQFKPGVDLAPWFFTRSIDADGTGWEYGHLWHALTEGIEGRDGVKRAPLVLLSDVDRADSAQAEWFRILTDSISGRIQAPDGKMVQIVPGTQFVCTANSCGSGDARGRMASANPIDASILDRLGRKIEATFLHWDDEGAILRGKYPQVAEVAPELFTQLGNATGALRKAIENETVYAEFTHRGLCEVLSEAEDYIHYAGGEVPKNLLKKSFKAWLDGLDADSRFEAKRVIDAHLTGGALDDDDEDDDFESTPAF
jgi:MoxR-like ATPase